MVCGAVRVYGKLRSCDMLLVASKAAKGSEAEAGLLGIKGEEADDQNDHDHEHEHEHEVEHEHGHQLEHCKWNMKCDT